MTEVPIEDAVWRYFVYDAVLLCLALVQALTQVHAGDDGSLQPPSILPRNFVIANRAHFQAPTG
eukprot:SAG11_NODE_1450_length_4883_cov_2.373955_3_plen_64_part_00